MTTPYDILIFEEGNCRMLPVNNRTEAIKTAKKQVRWLLEARVVKWSVKVLTGSQLIWHDSSRNRLLGLDSGPTLL